MNSSFDAVPLAEAAEQDGQDPPPDRPATPEIFSPANS
jgi:hypothetical protein